MEIHLPERDTDVPGDGWGRRCRREEIKLQGSCRHQGSRKLRGALPAGMQPLEFTIRQLPVTLEGAVL